MATTTVPIRAWHIVATSWRLAVGSLRVIALVFIIDLIQRLVEMSGGTLNRVLGDWAGPLLFYLPYYLLWPAVEGGLLAFANATLRDSGTSAIATFCQGIRRFYLPLLGLTAIWAISLRLLQASQQALFRTSTAVALLRPLTGSDIAMLTAIAVLIALGWYLWVLMMTLGPVAVVVDEVRSLKAVKRAWAIGRARAGWLVLIALVLGVTVAPVVTVGVIPQVLWGDGEAIVTVSLGLTAIEIVANALIKLVLAATQVQAYRALSSLPTK